VSEVAAGSPLVRGCANYFNCLWVGHRFVVHVDRAILRNQYHAFRIYDLNAGADVPSPLDGQTIYALEVRGALVYYTSLELTSGTSSSVSRIAIADPANPRLLASIVTPVTFSEVTVVGGWDLSADATGAIEWTRKCCGAGSVFCPGNFCTLNYQDIRHATSTAIFTRSNPSTPAFIAPDGSHAVALAVANNALQIVRQPLPSGVEDASAVPNGSSGQQDELIGWSADSQWVFDRQVALNGAGNNVSTSVYVVAAEGTAPATLVLTLHDSANLFFAPSD
jgi:hypothetical protein